MIFSSELLAVFLIELISSSTLLQ